MKSNSACLTILVVCFWFMSPFTQSEERGRNFRGSFRHVHPHSKLSTDKWSWMYGRTVEIMEGNEGIQQTLDSGYIMCGWTRTFSQLGIAQAWVLKLFPDGQIEWQKAYGGINPDAGVSIDQTLDGGYIMGAHSMSYALGGSDLWIVKFFPDGEIEWQKAYGGHRSDFISSVQQTLDGGYIVGAYSKSFSEGEDLDFWVLKLFPDGEIEWQKTYGSLNSERGAFIQQTLDGGYIVGGSSESFWDNRAAFWVLKLFPDGEIEWQKTYNTDQGTNELAYIQKTHDNGYIMVGKTTAFVHKDEGSDFLVVKLSPEGNIQWQKAYGGKYNESPRGVEQTLDRGYVVAGKTDSYGYGQQDFWVLKLFPDGEIEWQRTYGGGKGDATRSIKQTTDQGYIIAGFCTSFVSIDGDTHILVLKLDQNGEADPPELSKISDSTPKSVTLSSADTDVVPADTDALARITSSASEDTDIIPYRPEVFIVYPPINVSLLREANRSLFRKEGINIVSWEENPLNSELEIERYHVFRGERGQTERDYELAGIVSISTNPGATTFSYTDGNLPINNTYVYAVTTVTSDGVQSEKSDPVGGN